MAHDPDTIQREIAQLFEQEDVAHLNDVYRGC
jgi:hypothetical protein